MRLPFENQQQLNVFSLTSIWNKITQLGGLFLWTSVGYTEICVAGEKERGSPKCFMSCQVPLFSFLFLIGDVPYLFIYYLAFPLPSHFLPLLSIFLSASEKCTHLKLSDLHFSIKSVLKNAQQNYCVHNAVPITLQSISNKKCCHQCCLIFIKQILLERVLRFSSFFYYMIHRTLFSFDYGNNWTLHL